MKKRFLILAGLLLIATAAHADEFGAGKPNTADNEIGGILGSGGNVGSAGLGIQADEFSGAATFSVPIPLPPGRGGLTPKLTINYHSMRKNPGGWLGYGWDLSLGEIVRVPKYGNVDYYAGTDFEVRLLGQTERLNRVTWDVSPAAFGFSVKPGTTVDLYEARVDSSRNLYFHLYNKTNPESITDMGWVIIDKGGTRYEFDPLDSSASTDPNKTFVAGWMLTKITDTNGNVVDIKYGPDKRPNVIYYGDIAVQFTKTGFTKLRFFPMFREGFFAKDDVSRLDAIEVQTKSDKSRLLRYELVYTESTTNRALLLTSIKRLGKTDAAALPPITLSYFGNDQVAFKKTPTLVVASAENYEKGNSFNPGYIGSYADIMDLDGDARADLLLGFQNGTFMVRPVSGVAGGGQPVVLQDPLVGNCMGEGCLGMVNGVIKIGNFYNWVFVMDMNGDGAPDRVMGTNAKVKKPPQFQIAFGTPGKLGWDANLVVWNDPLAANDPGVNNHSAGLLDMNGDGLPDRIVGDAASGGFKVYFNTGHGFSDKAAFWKDPLAVTSQPEAGKLDAYDGDKLKVTIRDVTGDGLPDRVYRTEFIASDGSGGWKKEFGFHVAVNKNGLGWGQPKIAKDQGVCPAGLICVQANSYDTLLIADPLTVEADRGYISSSTYDLMDFNNDGYADRVEGKPKQGKILITYFSGQMEGTPKTYFDPTTTVELDDPVIDEQPKLWSVLGYLSYRYIVGGYQFAMVRDVNGDGYPDRLIWTPRDTQWLKEGVYVPRSIEIHPFVVNPIQFSEKFDLKESNQPVNALKEIDNGEGMKTAVEYIRSTDPDVVKNRYLPTPMTLVHKLYRTDTDAPVDVSPEGKRHPGMRWASYYYEGGNLYLRYGKPGKGVPDVEYQSRFNGFQSVTKWHKPLSSETWSSTVVETWFHQAKGDLTGAFVMDNSLEPIGYTEIALSGRPYRHEMREENELRLRQVKNWEIAPSPPSGDYANSKVCPFSECRPRLKKSVEILFEEGSINGRLRATDYGYDAEDNVTLEVTSGSKGKLITINTDYHPDSAFKSGLLIRNRVKTRMVSGGGTTWRKTSFDYDAAGNPVTETHYADAGNSLATKRKFGPYGNVIEWTGPDGVTHSHTYDGEQVFPITESITLPGGQVLTTKRGYHRITGKLTQEIDPHGVGSQMTLDDFGRPVTEYVIAATGAKMLLHNWSYEYFQAALLSGASGTILKTQMWESQPGYGMTKPWRVAYTDGNGRVRQSCSLAENGMYRRVQSQTQNGGRTRMQTVPQYDYDECEKWPQMGGAITVTTHDIFGRPTVVQPPVGDMGSPTAKTAMTYVTEPSTGNLIRKITLPNGTVRTEKINGLGQTVSVDEGANGATATYQYAPTGELLSTVIGGKEQMTAAYDWLGRKKTTTDADMGSWSYAYDTFGRLNTQTDAKAQKTVFDYDAVGRVTQKQYLAGGGGIEKVETYLYDSPGPGAKGFDVLPGELAQVLEIAPGGKTLRSSSFSYDASYRRMAKMRRGIAGVGDFTQSFVNNFKGQMTSTTYPGGKMVYQNYNAIGGLKQVCGSGDCQESYYHPDTFDAYGAVTEETFGNGVQVKNAYYPNTHRLQTRTTSRQGKDYAKREYQYNALSSLTSLSDPLKQVGSGAMSGIQYDAQDRLKGYQPKEGAAVTFTYAANGNILSNGDSATGKTYAYGGPRPHAVTQVGTDTFDYDANGNMMKDASRTMSYSAANQLTQVKMANGGVVDLDYDFTAARVLKKSVIKDVTGKTWQTTTHYLGEAMEIRLSPSPLAQSASGGGEGQGEGTGTAIPGTVLLHISANGQRVATMTVGTLSDVLKPAAGTLTPSPLVGEGWACPERSRRSEGAAPLVAFSLLLAMLIMCLPFTRGGRPVLRGGWGRNNSPPPRWGRVRVGVAYALIVLCLTPSIPVSAGDSGTPAIPPSDTNYLVFYHGDHLGSAQLITEGNTKGRHAGITYKRGDVIQRFEYAAYGRESFVLNPNLSWDPAFTGQQYDIETGLYYYRARYYNPILGRFIQPDTIVQDSLDPQSWNRYAYVENNPLKYTDPTGNFTDPEGNETDLNDAPHVNDSTDLHDDYHGMAFVDGVMAYVDNRADSSPDNLVGAAVERESGGRGNLETSAQNRSPARSPVTSPVQSWASTVLSSISAGRPRAASDFVQFSSSAGLSSYSAPQRQFLAPSAMDALSRIGRAWQRAGHRDTIQVGDISMANRQGFGNHDSHRRGIDVDIRPGRIGGAGRVGAFSMSPVYSREETQAIVNTIRENANVRVILFNDTSIIGVSRWRGHDDHLHISFR